jgi:uncharacterized membrane protein YhhN
MSPVAVFWFGIIAAIIYLPFSENPPNWGRSLAKTAPLLALAAAAWMAGGPVLLVLALALSALGDFALSRPGMRAFIAGLVAFAAAHLFYLILFTALSGRGPYMAFLDQTLLALFLGWVAISAEIWLVPHTGRTLRWPVRAYVLTITLMALAALTLPLGAVAIGAVYFVASDVILAYRNFRMDPDDPLSGRAGWLLWGLYIAGQAMILVGVLNIVTA